MAAPSACNKRPWSFLDELRKVSRYSNYNSPLMIVVCADLKRSLGKKLMIFGFKIVLQQSKIC